MKQRQHAASQSERIPLKVRVAQFFKGRVCESYLRYLLENNRREELQGLIDSNKYNPEKINSIEYLLYTILSYPTDASITKAMRDLGSEMRGYALSIGLGQ